MESLESYIEKAQELNGKRLRYRRKEYRVTQVNYRLGRIVVKTATNWLVFDVGRQFDDFMQELQEINDNEPESGEQATGGVIVMPARNYINRKYKQSKIQEKIMEANDKAMVTASTENADKINKSLMTMFETLSGNPTEEDFKKAEAMCKVTSTIVSVTQTQINLFRISNGK